MHSHPGVSGLFVFKSKKFEIDLCVAAQVEGARGYR